MATLSNTCEGTSGTAISISNSAGPNQFNQINITGTGSTFAWDNTRSHADSTSAKLHLAAVSSSGDLRWTSASISATANGYSRFYVYMTARPSVNARIATLVTSAGALCAVLQITTTGTIRTLNSASATIATSTGTIPLNAWCRVEFEVISISGSSGTVNARIYSGANLETNTPDTNGSLTNAAQAVGGNVGGLRVGVATAVTESPAWDSWWDDVAWSDTALLGPSSTTVTGTLSAATPLATATLTGTQTDPATLDATAPTLSGSATGTQTDPGTLTTSTLLPTATLSGTQVDFGTLAAVTPDLTATVSGTSVNPGTLAAAAPRTTAALADTLTNPGTMAASMPTATASLSGTMTNSGTLTAAVPVVAASLPGASTIAGTLAAPIPLATAQANGTSLNPGTLAASPRAPTATITGTSTNPASLTASVPVLALVAAGTTEAQVDITVTGQLDPRRWAATLPDRAKSGTLTPRDKTGTLADRAWAGTLDPRRWKGTL